MKQRCACVVDDVGAHPSPQNQPARSVVAVIVWLPAAWLAVSQPTGSVAACLLDVSRAGQEQATRRHYSPPDLTTGRWPARHARCSGVQPCAPRAAHRQGAAPACPASVPLGGSSLSSVATRSCLPSAARVECVWSEGLANVLAPAVMGSKFHAWCFLQVFARLPTRHHKYGARTANPYLLPIKR